jgi:hypothetical protein
MAAARAVRPHRWYGMTRPWWLILVVATVVVTVFAAMAAGSVVTWAAWSLGGILIGALVVTFDAKKRKD